MFADPISPTTYRNHKKVMFSPEVDLLEDKKRNRQIQNEIIKLLRDSVKLRTSDIDNARSKVEQAKSIVTANFEKDSFAYNKLTSKCLIQEAILTPVDERDPIINKANYLDLTLEKFNFMRGLPF